MFGDVAKQEASLLPLHISETLRKLKGSQRTLNFTKRKITSLKFTDEAAKKAGVRIQQKLSRKCFKLH